MRRTVVVLVEDDPMNRIVAIDALERAGFEVANFARADEAASYAECMPDTIAALLADISVPGEQDGLDLARTFVERWPDKIVVLTSGLSGSHLPGDLPQGVEFISKPWTAKDLMACMADAMRPDRSA